MQLKILINESKELDKYKKWASNFMKFLYPKFEKINKEDVSKKDIAEIIFDTAIEISDDKNYRFIPKLSGFSRNEKENIHSVTHAIGPSDGIPLEFSEMVDRVIRKDKLKESKNDLTDALAKMAMRMVGDIEKVRKRSKSELVSKHKIGGKDVSVYQRTDPLEGIEDN